MRSSLLLVILCLSCSRDANRTGAAPVSYQEADSSVPDSFVPDSPPPPITPIVDAGDDARCELATIGWWESSFQGIGNRATNVELAAASLNDRIVEPGSELSYNDAVGERTLDRGYKFAPVISKGEMESGIGGGVCQVSSTMYAAALTADLEIVQRIPHSRPAAYMPIGLDATVGFPTECGGDHRSRSCYAPDLRIRNNLEFPITVTAMIKPHSKKSGHKVLRVEINGCGPVGSRPIYAYGAKKKDHFTRKEKRIGGAPVDLSKRTQKGLDGMLVTSSFTWDISDGTKKTRSFRTEYPTTDEIWEVSADRPDDASPPWIIPDAGAPDAN